ncbi:MAG: nucleotide sugar dehydrogenase [Proteobacteria bacterium]|nr:nucleotide sugar dehydrogenase [Pseudomonadota bacterium]
MQERIAIIGLGYVGLPLALAFGRVFPKTVGFDIDQKRVDALRQGVDHSGEADKKGLASSKVNFTTNPEDLAKTTFFIIGVPTPIDEHRRPDLTALQHASRTVGQNLSPGDVVVYESTVYPGVTEEICGPILAAESGLECGRDFFLAYSPERINPGDKVHRLENVIKVVAGQDEATLERVAGVYEQIVEAGTYRAPSIKVAEAAKVIENTQRDLNIALMNELAIIFDRLGIRTTDVLAAAGTKWNFLKFHPGLVGGHCIGVDPYYLTAKAEQTNYHPEIILAGRRINDTMGRYVALRVLKALARNGIAGGRAKVGVLGLTFKENVPDTRNSRVPDMVSELREHAVTVMLCDPLADPVYAQKEYGLKLTDVKDLPKLDALIVAVAHRQFLDPAIAQCVRPGGLVFDVKSIWNPSDMPGGVEYQSL